MATSTILLLRLTPRPLPSSLPTTTTPSLSSSFRLPLRRRLTSSPRMSLTSPSFPDRLLSAVSYTLPLFNSLPYSHFLFAQHPRLASLILDPIQPLFSAYKSIPYAPFIAFFALYLGVVRNNRFSRYVRFNAMQAVVLDVMLVLPVLIQRAFTPGFNVLIWGYNGVFLVSLGCFVYGVVCSVLGKIPYLPFVADAASRQL